ncbi:hypothetical protein R1flu_018456 [Riccia fluitans]|uniref:Uncharacterized protein n=1 Tax=Riccia fluitans TaxID=41844 RepID=A0ABD1ZG29_9MARC
MGSTLLATLRSNHAKHKSTAPSERKLEELAVLPFSGVSAQDHLLRDLRSTAEANESMNRAYPVIPKSRF